uniref:Uncharacterized protein n=1 Tax=candidate division WWE3 bacterium TaxID=2053526 RepID=A0A832E1S8_UNCKA
MEAPRRPNRKKLTLFLVAFLALLGLAAFAIWYFTFRGTVKIGAVERISYAADVSFDAETLSDLSGTVE